MMRPTTKRVCKPKPTIITQDTRVWKLLNTPNAVLRPKKFTPLIHPDLYFLYLEDNGIDSKPARILHATHPPAAQPDVIVKRVLPIPANIDDVYTETIVKKNGEVVTQVCDKMSKMYKEFYAKGIKPPLDVRVRACKSFGYPNDILLDMIAKEAKRMAISSCLGNCPLCRRLA